MKQEKGVVNMLSLTRDEVIKNQINYYIERIIFLKGRVLSSKIEMLQEKDLKSIKWCQKRIEKLTSELIEVK
jgi:hypothetical protein